MIKLFLIRGIDMKSSILFIVVMFILVNIYAGDTNCVFRFYGKVEISSDPEGASSFVTMSAGVGDQGTSFSDQNKMIYVGTQYCLVVEKEGNNARGQVQIAIPPSSAHEHPCTAGKSPNPDGLRIKGFIAQIGGCDECEVTINTTIIYTWMLLTTAGGTASTGNFYIDTTLIMRDQAISGLTKYTMQQDNKDRFLVKTIVLKKGEKLNFITVHWNFPSCNNASIAATAVNSIVTLALLFNAVSWKCLK